MGKKSETWKAERRTRRRSMSTTYQLEIFIPLNSHSVNKSGHMTSQIRAWNLLHSHSGNAAIATTGYVAHPRLDFDPRWCRIYFLLASSLNGRRCRSCQPPSVDCIYLFKISLFRRQRKRNRRTVHENRINCRIFENSNKSEIEIQKRKYF